jgi:adenosylhomocysteine nucleosidase
MHTLIVAPMELERRAVVRAARHNCGIVTVTGGVGMAAAAATTERVLRANQPARVVVVGVAGGIGPSARVGEIVVPEKVLDGATRATYKPASLPGINARGTLLTYPDGLLVDRSTIAAYADIGVVAVDMETAAVAKICQENGVPWSVVRAISDRAGDAAIGAEVLGLLRQDGRANPKAAVRYLLGRPSRAGLLIRLARDTRTAAGKAAAVAVMAVSASSGA